MVLIAKIRKKIDKIDKNIIKLLNKRAELCEKIGVEKSKNKQNIEDPKREREILKNLDKKYLKNIYKIILEESKKKQKTL